MIATVLSFIAFLLLLLACSGGSPMGDGGTAKPPTGDGSAKSSSNSVSIEEYARLACANEGEDDFPDDATWGEYVESLEEGLDRIEVITPPSELRAYHNAIEAVAKSSLEFAKSKPKDDLVNPFEMIEASDVLILGLALETEVEALPDDVRDELVRSGCTDLQRESEDTDESWNLAGQGQESGAEYTRQQDPLTDEVTLFFVSEATDGYGSLVIRSDCDGNTQPFVDVRIWTSAGNEADLLVRFDDDETLEETWVWENVYNTPGDIPETLLTPPQDRAAEIMANLMASEKLAVRYPETNGSRAETFVFDTESLRDLWNREGFKGCE